VAGDVVQLSNSFQLLLNRIKKGFQILTTMAKNICVAVFVFVLLSVTSASDVRVCVTGTYLLEIGTKEATGKNDGERVGQYQAVTGTGAGASWCASFVKWCFLQCGLSVKMNAWSPTAHNRNNVVWYQRKWNKEPEPGDVFTIYSASLKRICHTGFFHRKVNESIYESVEGNTNSGGSSNGDGVYKRRRSFNSTYSITRWL
jgi:hypothetical protein